MLSPDTYASLIESSPRTSERFEEGKIVLNSNSETYIYNGRTSIAAAAIDYTLEIPQDLREDIPIVFVPGFGGIKPAYKSLRNEIVKAGKPAVSFKPARSQNLGAGYHPKHLFHPERLLQQSTWAVMRDIEANVGFDKFDLSGHSMGGPAVVGAAMQQTEHVRSIIMVAAAGLNPVDQLTLGKRFGDFLVTDLMPNIWKMKVQHESSVAIEAISYFLRNPKRTIGEALAVSGADSRFALRRLGQIGVKTAALQFKNDKIFPVDEVREMSGDVVDMFIYDDPKAGHVEPQLNPKEVAFEHLSILKQINNSEHGNLPRVS